MNKCEHGEKITVFCASDCCVWKEAAGCDLCIKKYHNHMGPTIFLSEEQIIALVKKYTMDSSIKPKCRILQQAIYSYFNLIKNEVSTSIDTMCKNIINQIGYPYLYSNNTLSTYKRLKNKEYKKLVQKQFKNLYQLSQKIQQKQLIKQQSRIYIQEMKHTEQLLNNLEDIIKKYENAIKHSNPTFSHDSSYIIKINQILKSLNIDSALRISQTKEIKEKSVTKPEMTTSLVKEKQQPKLKTLQLKKTVSDNTAVPRTPMISINPPSTRPNYSRDVSIDRKIVKEHKFNSGLKVIKENDKQATKQKEKQKQKQKDETIRQTINSDKIETLKLQLNNKEVEINQKKRMLIEMMKTKQDNLKKSRNQLQKKESEPAPKIVKQVPSYFKRQLSQRSASKQVTNQTQKYQQFDINLKISNDESQDNSNNQLQMEQIGLKTLQSQQNQQDSDVQNHAFTQLPVVQKQLKRSSQLQEVKQKVLIIPTASISPNTAQIDSPLFKNFNKSNVYNKPKENQNFKDKIIEDKQDLTKNRGFIFSKHNQVLQLKQNQEKSLALLLKSLTLNAQQAIKYLESALNHAQNNLSAAEYLTYLYLQQDKPQSCLHLCNKMLQKMQNSSQPQQKALIINNNKAAALNILGRYSESIFIIQKCLRYRQKDYLYKNLGDAYFSISIYEKAIYNYEKTLKINQCYDQAQYNLAVCLYIQQNYHNAKLAIKKALQMQPQNDSYLQLLYNIETRINHC